MVLYSTWVLLTDGQILPQTEVKSTGDGCPTLVRVPVCPCMCVCTVHAPGSRTVRETQNIRRRLSGEASRGVFPACLAARSFSVARRSYLSAGLHLLVRVSISGRVRGVLPRAWLFPRGDR